MSPKTPHPSSFEIDKLALQEPASPLPGSHLGACPRCQEDLAQTRAEADHFTQAVRPRTLPDVRRRLTRRRFRLWQLSVIAAPALAAASVMLAMRVHWAHQEGAAPAVGIKGPAALRLFVRRGTRVFDASDGRDLRPGDAIRLVVPPAGEPYLLVASVDAQAKASIYWPFGGAQSGRIDPKARFELPGSITLDPASPERIFIFYSRKPLLAEDVLTLLRSLGARGGEAIRTTERVAVPAEQQTTLLLEKRAP
ncbi:MAG TPA: hypothetical protein VKN99_19090 [Polyangia bacterium]|nr:hypothetical protein [Polyangia bacterium]